MFAYNPCVSLLFGSPFCDTLSSVGAEGASRSPGRPRMALSASLEVSTIPLAAGVTPTTGGITLWIFRGNPEEISALPCGYFRGNPEEISRGFRRFVLESLMNKCFGLMKISHFLDSSAFLLASGYRAIKCNLMFQVRRCP